MKALIGSLFHLDAVVKLIQRFLNEWCARVTENLQRSLFASLKCAEVLGVATGFSLT